MFQDNKLFGNLKNLTFSKIKFCSFENRNFQKKTSKNDPRLKNLRQMEIAFALSPGADTHQKSNFNI